MTTTLPPLPARFPLLTMLQCEHLRDIIAAVPDIGDKATREWTIADMAFKAGRESVEAGQASRVQAIPQALIEALRFYANNGHSEWSGGVNANDDGSIARRALCGTPINWVGEDALLMTGPIEGEADFALAPVVRVPMTLEQMRVTWNAWLRTREGVDGSVEPAHISYTRAVEAHHGITSSTGSAT